MSLRRHILQAVALVTAAALVFGAFAGSAGAKKISKSQKAKVRAELRKQIKKNPGVIKRRVFLRKAALVNFKLPVTIRLRNVCDASQNPTGSTSPGGALLTTQNCAAQGTALNQRSVPSARVNLGPSLGSRDIAIGGALAAVVEFQDTYDGGALGNVNIKILPGNKTLTTSSVPLLWNTDITDPTRVRTRTSRSRSHVRAARLRRCRASWTPRQAGLWRLADRRFGREPGLSGATLRSSLALRRVQGAVLRPAGEPRFRHVNGLPGYTVYNAGGSPNGVFLPVFPDGDPSNLQAGGVVGSNDWIGTNPNPFPTGSAPTTSGGSPDPSIYNAQNTVLRTNALSLAIAPGGVSVNMSTGTATTPGGLTTAQGSQDVTLGYSGGQANLFGNIPGKNVGIDVTVNLATKINAIARIMDQDVFKQPSLIEGEPYPAGIFNCRQIFTGAVQNYIPGVRLTGSLRIAPAITKDGKVRIAKATVQSDVNNPDRVALSACLFPAKSYNAYVGTSTDTARRRSRPLRSCGRRRGSSAPARSSLETRNTALPESSAERYPNLAEGNAPSTVPCGVRHRAPAGGHHPSVGPDRHRQRSADPD